MPGSLFVIAAPSGTGKTSLVKALLEREPGICLSVSYTTRPARPGEIDGVHYHFIARQQFESMIASGDFFEHFVVHGDLKGTARSAVVPLLESGKDVLLEIDWQGARKVRELMPSCVGVFILPPSRDALESRMRKRAQDSEEVIAKRMANCKDEISHAHEFDYVLINDDFERALDDLSAIVRSTRLRRVVMGQKLDDLVSQLLA